MSGRRRRRHHVEPKPASFSRPSVRTVVVAVIAVRAIVAVADRGVVADLRKPAVHGLGDAEHDCRQMRRECWAALLRFVAAGKPWAFGRLGVWAFGVWRSLFGELGYRGPPERIAPSAKTGR